jgi:hypothetical protein
MPNRRTLRLVNVCVCVIVLIRNGGKREEKEGGQQALDNGLQNVQLTLSMGPARMEVCGNIERATIPRRRVVLHYCIAANTTCNT